MSTAPCHPADRAARLTPVPLTDAQLAASRDAVLAGWNGREPRWVFAYGSLIWDPEMEFDQRVLARVHGYHRRLCLRSVQYRGTPDRPGLVAGLDRGGCCAGVAYRIPARGLTDQFERLWRREMLLGAYEPRWLHCRRLDHRGGLVALGFVVRRDSNHFCARLGDSELIEILTGARGHRGSNLDYLLRTTEALRVAGVPDRHLERLVRKARAALGANANPSEPGPQAGTETDVHRPSAH